MSTYGTLESRSHEDEENLCSPSRDWRESLKEFLENERFHVVVLGLILLDAICVITQIVYTFFHECQVPDLFFQVHEKPNYSLIAFELAEVISLVVCVLFLFECFLHLIGFGFKYYLPGYPHWKLHLFDTTVIVTTFVLEFVLKGKEREVAGLLITLRLWRIVKVTEAAIMGVSYAHEEALERLKADYAELEAKYKEQLEINQQLTNGQE